MENAYGAIAVTTLEATDVVLALGQIINSHFPFDIWYRQRLQELYGINLAGYDKFLQPLPIASNQELLFEWTLDSNISG